MAEPVSNWVGKVGTPPALQVTPHSFSSTARARG